MEPGTRPCQTTLKQGSQGPCASLPDTRACGYSLDLLPIYLESCLLEFCNNEETPGPWGSQMDFYRLRVTVRNFCSEESHKRVRTSHPSPLASPRHTGMVAWWGGS